MTMRGSLFIEWYLMGEISSVNSSFDANIKTCSGCVFWSQKRLK